MKHTLISLLVLLSMLVVMVAVMSCQKKANPEYDAKITDLENRIKEFEGKLDKGFYKDEDIKVVMQSHADSQELFKEAMDYFTLHGDIKGNEGKKDLFSDLQEVKMEGLIERIRLVTHYLDSLSDSKLRELEAVLPAGL